MLQVFPVPPPLSHWLDGAVIVRMGPHQHESRFPAMPRAMLVMHLLRSEARAPWSVAQAPTFLTLTTQPTVYTHAAGISALGVIVRPAAAACLLALSGVAGANLTMPWSHVAGPREGERLALELGSADSEGAFLGALVSSFCRAMEGVAAERWLEAEQLCAAVGRLGAKAGAALGIGRRQLERRCRGVLGVPPKQFERLERFHRALTAVVSQDAPSLAQESLEAGYCDQSHLALDARQLGGASVLQMKSLASAHSPWWSLATPRLLSEVRQAGGSASLPSV